MTMYSLGDPATWPERYGSELYHFAFRRLRVTEDAEDVLQETFVTALRNLGSYRAEISERSWLYMILRSRIVDHVRKRNRYPTNDLPWNEEINEEDQYFDAKGRWITPPEFWPSDPSEILENTEFGSVLEQCLNHLPEHQRQVFIARVIDGHEADVVTDAFNVSTSNLWVLVHRARLKLRTCLETHWFQSR